jgi:preprotein translocase subunit SecE
MTSIQKYVNALFIAAAAIVWLVTSHYTDVVVGYFQLGRRIGGAVDFLNHGVPFLFAGLTFLILKKNTTALNFSTDAIAELIRVHWPSQKDVTLGTIVVIITVIVAGIALGVLDLGLTALIRTIIGV